jgi:hypothetical protein
MNAFTAINVWYELITTRGLSTLTEEPIRVATRVLLESIVDKINFVKKSYLQLMHLAPSNMEHYIR